MLSKSESWFFLTIYDPQGSHNKSCHFKQIASRHALGFLHAIDDKNREVNEQIDVTDKMLARAAEITTKDLSLPPRKIHEMVLNEIKGQYRFLKVCLTKKSSTKFVTVGCTLMEVTFFEPSKPTPLPRSRTPTFFFCSSTQLFQQIWWQTWAYDWLWKPLSF